MGHLPGALLIAINLLCRCASLFGESFGHPCKENHCQEQHAPQHRTHPRKCMLHASTSALGIVTRVKAPEDGKHSAFCDVKHSLRSDLWNPLCRQRIRRY
jgi:hypothetical protein